MAGHSPRFPHLPKPLRYLYDSDADFHRAMQNYEYEKKRRAKIEEEDTRSFMAMLILIVLFLLFFVLSITFVLFGWRGPVGLILGVGLLWAAHPNIKSWL
jgi:hypothetical protein